MNAKLKCSCGAEIEIRESSGLLLDIPKQPEQALLDQFRVDHLQCAAQRRRSKDEKEVLGEDLLTGQTFKI